MKRMIDGQVIDGQVTETVRIRAIDAGMVEQGIAAVTIVGIDLDAADVHSAIDSLDVRVGVKTVLHDLVNQELFFEGLRSRIIA